MALQEVSSNLITIQDLMEEYGPSGCSVSVQYLFLFLAGEMYISDHTLMPDMLSL